MKEYLVRYKIGAYVYESTIRTSSSAAVFLWVDNIGGYHPHIVFEKEVEE